MNAFYVNLFKNIPCITVFETANEDFFSNCWLTVITINPNNITNILVKCIDDNITSKIGLQIINDIVREKYIDKIPKLSAIIVIEPIITLEQQKN